MFSAAVVTVQSMFTSFFYCNKLVIYNNAYKYCVKLVISKKWPNSTQMSKSGVSVCSRSCIGQLSEVRSSAVVASSAAVASNEKKGI